VLVKVVGMQHVSTLFGFAFLSHQVGSFFGSWLGGLMFDATGSYAGVWIVIVLLGVLGGPINLPIDERPLQRSHAGGGE
jgi:MFS-type transporter involved in bile tolerance (Atg22 family)